MAFSSKLIAHYSTFILKDEQDLEKGSGFQIKDSNP